MDGQLTDAPAGGDPIVESGDPSTGLIEPRVGRRIGFIWGLLVFNCLGTLPGGFLPRPVLQLLTMGSLALAVLLSIVLNRRLLFRPNLVLTLCTVLAAVAFMTSVRGLVGLGAVVRSVRLFGFLAVLWLLTPWWDRRDLLLARCHVRALAVVLGSVVAGLLLFPSRALPGSGSGRLTGVLWFIPPTQVGEYAAVVGGMATVLWLSGAMARRSALFVDTVAIAIVLISRTRTALVAALAGVLVAGLTLFLKRQSVRRMARTVLLLVPVAAVAFAPAASGWFLRNQSSEQIGGLTGRKQQWERATAAPRTEFEKWFGFGLSDKSFDGLPIDSTWIATYQDQGLIGVTLVAAIFLDLLVVTAFRRAGPERALATFLLVYCAIASYTEVGLGDVSPYLLHVVVAASLLAGTRKAPDARPHPGADARAVAAGVRANRDALRPAQEDAPR